MAPVNLKIAFEAPRLSTKLRSYYGDTCVVSIEFKKKDMPFKKMTRDF